MWRRSAATRSRSSPVTRGPPPCAAARQTRLHRPPRSWALRARTRAGPPVRPGRQPGRRNVYVTATESNALAVFSRNRSTGALRQLRERRAASASRREEAASIGRALNEPVAVAVSPDGERVYVAGRRASRRRGDLGAGTRWIARAARRGSAGCVTTGRAGRLRQRARHALPGGRRRQPGRARSVFVAGMRSNSVDRAAERPPGSHPAARAGRVHRHERRRRVRASGKPCRDRSSSRSRPTAAASTWPPRSPTPWPILRSDRATGALSQARGKGGASGRTGSRRCTRGRRSTRSGASP